MNEKPHSAPENFSASMPTHFDACHLPSALVADDYPANALLIETLLEELNFVCDFARNGQEAFDKYRLAASAKPYRLVLMDIQMPLLGGYDAVRKIRAHERLHQLAEVPVIGLTAHQISGIRERCLESGMNDYLPKPFLFAELRHKIGSLCSIED
jgi:CheY-like chemotaxis protein